MAHAQTDTILTTQPEKKSLIQTVEGWYARNMNYGTIMLLMTVESSFIPFPSEVVIPPAAYIASLEGEKNPNHLNIFLVVVFGTLGALLGAYLNYFLALWLGRPLIHKLVETKVGRLFGLSSEKVDRAEKYFDDHGKTATLVGRFIPVIRQLISLPAGLAKMNFFHFTVFTLIGAMGWNIVLALLGYIAGGQQELIDKYSHEISYVVLVLLALVCIYWVFKYFRKRKKKQAK